MRKMPVMAALVMGLGSVAARAESAFPVQGGGGSLSGTGTLYVSINSGSIPASYTIQHLVQTGSDAGATTVLAPGSFQGNDNLFFPGDASLLSTNGFSFTDEMDGEEFRVNIRSTGEAGRYAADVVEPDGDQDTGLDVSFALDTSATSPSRGKTSVAQGLLDMASRNEGGATTSLSGGTQPLAFRVQYAVTLPDTPGGTGASSVTPEPGTFALLGTGFLGLAGLLRKKHALQANTTSR